MSWRISREGKVRGPFTEPEVFELIGRGKVGRGDFVSFAEGQWFPIEEAPAFGPSLTMPAQVMPFVPPAPNFGYQPQFYPPPVGLSIPHDGCRYCGALGGKVTKTQVTGTGWIVFCVFLLLCFPISIVALVSMRVTRVHCGRCNAIA